MSQPFPRFSNSIDWITGVVNLVFINIAVRLHRYRVEAYKEMFMPDVSGGQSSVHMNECGQSDLD
jgi:hypothetical protein